MGVQGDKIFIMELTIHSKKYGNHTVAFDEADRPIIDSYTWSLFKPKDRNKFYAVTCVSKRIILMHRLLVKSDLQIDHIDGNGLNNQRNNLRPASNSQNAMNKGGGNGTSSGFKGVSWHKKAGKWLVQIIHNGIWINGGFFESKIEAAERYNELAIEYHGEFAKLNEIPKTQPQ